MVISELGVKLDVLTSGDAVPEGRTGTRLGSLGGFPDDHLTMKHF